MAAVNVLFVGLFYLPVVGFGLPPVAAHCFLSRLQSSFLFTMNNFLVTEGQ